MRTSRKHAPYLMTHQQRCLFLFLHLEFVFFVYCCCSYLWHVVFIATVRVRSWSWSWSWPWLWSFSRKLAFPFHLNEAFQMSPKWIACLALMTDNLKAREGESRRERKRDIVRSLQLAARHSKLWKMMWRKREKGFLIYQIDLQSSKLRQLMSCQNQHIQYKEFSVGLPLQLERPQYDIY